MEKKAIFLDRDGVITQVLFDGDWLTTCRQVGEIKVLEGVKPALDKLKTAGYVLIVVTNQPNIARGEMTVGDLNAIHQRLRKEFKLPIDGFYYCPHDGSDGCNCKKPKTGMIIEQALRDFPTINLKQSFVVGDRQGDMELGRTIGCRTILIPSPATLWLTEKKPTGDYRAFNLTDAVSLIINS